MKELYLDIGNSFLKMATRKNSEWHIVFDGELARFDELRKKVEAAGENIKILVSSVRKEITLRLNESLPGVEIQEYRASDIPARMLNYKTPQTLGLDRFLACLGAVQESKNRNVIVIDAGSACTVDLMTEEGVFMGGIIMPGLKLIHSAMRDQLPELPVVQNSIPETWPGKSTTECIEWGVNGGFVFAIRGFINKYQAMVGDIDIYVTGGNARQIISWMGNDEAVIYRKNLIWNGMEEFGAILKNAESSY